MSSIITYTGSAFGPKTEQVYESPVAKFCNLIVVIIVIISVTRFIVSILRFVFSKPSLSDNSSSPILPVFTFFLGLFGSVYLFYDMFKMVKEKGGGDINAVAGSVAESLVPFMIGIVATILTFVIWILTRAINRGTCKRTKNQS